MKLKQKGLKHASRVQPPSGGCVLKRQFAHDVFFGLSAAFGRLGVETALVVAPRLHLARRLRAAVC